MSQLSPDLEPRGRTRLNPRAVIAGVLSIVVIGLAIWYLVRPEPLLVQGEAESTRIDIAARVSGRLAKVSVVRGQDVGAATTLLVIDNPELIVACIVVGILVVEPPERAAAHVAADAELGCPEAA